MVMKSIRAAATRMLSRSDVRKGAPKEPQTAHMVGLHHEFAGHPSRGMTPSKLAAILDQAETGDIVGQYELFEDMEEKDGHIMSEMGKRRRAVLGLEWDIVPPKNPSQRERDNAKALQELMMGLEDLEDTIFDITDAIGKAFANLEFDGWHRVDGDWVPRGIIHRPQSWFQLVRGQRQEIRLRGAAGGIELEPFGWITHTHKAKSGYLERAALFRVLVWPYLFKNYSVGDLAEFLEIYGIPMRVGKYPSGATKDEKLALLRALAQLGHNAAGIVPNGMELEFLKSAEGDPAAFELMIDWCEKTQSKAILGGTLTSQADGKTSTNALGNVHNEVRLDLRDSDAGQVAKTISRDLVYPMAVLNGLTESWARCPRFVFNTQQAEDLADYAKALPSLVRLGFQIPRQWAQERVAIPEPEDGEDILAMPSRPAAGERPAVASAAAQRPTLEETPAPPGQMLERTREALQPITDRWIDQVRALLDDVESLEEFRSRLVELYPQMTLDQYADALAEAMAASHLAGRNEVTEESPDALR